VGGYLTSCPAKDVTQPENGRILLIPLTQTPYYDYPEHRIQVGIEAIRRQTHDRADDSVAMLTRLQCCAYELLAILPI